MIRATITITMEFTETFKAHDELVKIGKTYSEFVHQSINEMAQDIVDEYFPEGEDTEWVNAEINVKFQDYL